MISQHPSPYCVVEVRPGRLRIQPDHAASRAIAAEIEARERAAAEAARPFWQRLFARPRRLKGPAA